MFATKGKGGGYILVANSEEFKRLVQDIIGPMGLREAESLTGISATYIGAMKNKGHVPNEEMIGKLAAGFGLDDKRANQLFEAAAKVRPGISPEALLQVACQAAGLSTSARLALLDHFRAALEAQENEQSAA